MLPRHRWRRRRSSDIMMAFVVGCVANNERERRRRLDDDDVFIIVFDLPAKVLRQILDLLWLSAKLTSPGTKEMVQHFLNKIDKDCTLKFRAHIGTVTIDTLLHL